MTVEYDKRIEKYFMNRYKEMQRKIGPEFTKSTKKRVDELRAADNFQTFMSTGLGKPHPLNGDLSEYFGVNVSANYRLVIELVDKDAFTQCDKVTVKGVVDYHGEKYNWVLP